MQLRQRRLIEHLVEACKAHLLWGFGIAAFLVVIRLLVVLIFLFVVAFVLVRGLVLVLLLLLFSLLLFVFLLDALNLFFQLLFLLCLDGLFVDDGGAEVLVLQMAGAYVEEVLAIASDGPGRVEATLPSYLVFGCHKDATCGAIAYIAALGRRLGNFAVGVNVGEGHGVGTGVNFADVFELDSEMAQGLGRQGGRVSLSLSFSSPTPGGGMASAGVERGTGEVGSRC